MCAIEDECKARFFSGEATEDTQFARDLLQHLQLLYDDGHLTPHFFRLAFGVLGKSIPLDTGFQGLVEQAAACLADKRQGET